MTRHTPVQPSSSPSHAAQQVDPQMNRPANAAELAPETLIPDVERAGGDAPATDRESRIAKLAYQRALRRGFHPGSELDDWLQAEREVDTAPPSQTRPEDQFTG